MILQCFSDSRKILAGKTDNSKSSLKKLVMEKIQNKMSVSEFDK